jgi:hypothetical protein
MRTVTPTVQTHDDKLVLRKLVLYALVLGVLEVAFALLDADAPILILVAAVVVGTAAYDILRTLRHRRSVATGALASALLLGGFMALDEAGVAPHVVHALFYGLVATAAGIAIVAIGGGGIEAMRDRWELAMARAEADRPLRRDTNVDVDLRDRTPVPTPTSTPTSTPAPVMDDTTLVPASSAPSAPSGDGLSSSTQDRIRAEIRSEADTLP